MNHTLVVISKKSLTQGQKDFLLHFRRKMYASIIVLGFELLFVCDARYVPKFIFFVYGYPIVPAIVENTLFSTKLFVYLC